MSSIADNIRAVRERVARAAERSGRDANAIVLCAVSKTKPASMVRAAAAAGCADFGENYAQELLAKAAELGEKRLRWHHIGRLQRNKVKALVGKVHLLHGVDRAELLAEIDKRAGAAGVRAAVLIEVNVAAEAQKGGARPDQLAELCAEARRCGAIELRGLMTVPPAGGAEDSRRWFRELRRLRDSLAEPALTELSMGMSHDFEIAVEEGATIVRVGTAIFGDR